MTRKGRRLSPEEERLWQKITETTTPLKISASTDQPLIRKKNVQGKPKTAPAFRVDHNASLQKPATRMPSSIQPLRMDRKTFNQMKRGKTSPEARIDLHGMTVDVAHTALRAFLLRSHSERKRLVLVITGKGQHDGTTSFFETGRGVLRRQVPLWLEQAPLRQIVLQTATAHEKHGGSGAIYVYLTR